MPPTCNEHEKNEKNDCIVLKTCVVYYAGMPRVVEQFQLISSGMRAIISVADQCRLVCLCLLCSVWRDGTDGH
jgi:hypothetical protein